MMDLTSMPEDQMRLILCLFIQIFIGLFMNSFVTGDNPAIKLLCNMFCGVGGPTIRLLYNMFCGVFLTTYMFRETSYFIFLMAIGAYIIMSIFPRDKQQYYTTGFVITFLSL
jgi:hypothetical protein